MKTIETSLGKVNILDARIVRKSGYGQYNLEIDIEHEGINKTIRLHSTDSQLFDRASDAEDNASRSELVMREKADTIEREVEDYISSL